MEPEILYVLIAITISSYRSTVFQYHAVIVIGISMLKRFSHHPKKRKKLSRGDRKILCYKCGKEIFTNAKAQAVVCCYCYHHNDLSDYKIKAVLGKNIETHGTLYLKRKGVIEISSIRVGNAIIKGKIHGDLYAMGTVEILKPGEICGKITCRKLIVKKGGIFNGSVRMLNANTNIS